ncbi:hypothetical protein COCON_G00005380 [Conger conger]|uniref:Uncharacterized protein n=1 Tax=Conger conger TaxID=82655 RepID=A0A9Q1I7N8_CONCO|nr:hypothetical protein COCON_G00005380 [Conger conger]
MSDPQPHRLSLDRQSQSAAWHKTTQVNRSDKPAHRHRRPVVCWVTGVEAETKGRGAGNHLLLGLWTGGKGCD